MTRIFMMIWIQGLLPEVIEEIENKLRDIEGFSNRIYGHQKPSEAYCLQISINSGEPLTVLISEIGDLIKKYPGRIWMSISNSPKILLITHLERVHNSKT